ncbi:Rid family hydrolase [Sphingobacterium athyrii]|uniref:Rid family hydrolase n=1 Tax=Sphingobacterium athyrii TaxID=2152717 RepID=UPI001C634D52
MRSRELCQQTIYWIIFFRSFVSENNQSDFQHITKTTSFLTDIKQFETVNKIYGSYFKNSLPARSTVEVSS